MQQKSTTNLSSIQMNEVLHDTAFSGKATAEAFKAYLENDLLPYLSNDSILIMDESHPNPI